MKFSLSKFLQIAIPLALGIFLVWYIYQSFTPEQLLETQYHFENANYWIVILSVACSILSHISRSYRWGFMLEPLGYTPKLANSFMALSSGYLLNLFIPKSGEVSRAVVMDKYEDIPFEKGFGTIISERIVDVLFLLFFTVLALVLEFDALYDYVNDSIPASAMYLAVFGILLVLISIPLYLKFSKSNINKKIKSFIMGLKEGVFSILAMKKNLAFIFHTFVIWILYILSLYIAMQALPETSHIPIGTILITFVVGSFTFAFTNSGFGTYPTAVAGIMAVFGIAKTVGIALGWIVWISSTFSIVILGVLSFIILPLYNQKRLAKRK